MTSERTGYPNQGEAQAWKRQSMDIRKTLANQAKRYEELNRLLARPETVADLSRLQRYVREHAELEEMVHDYHALLAIDQHITEAQKISEDSDLALRDLASEEIAYLKGQREDLMNRIKVALLPKDPLSAKNAVMTIQPETENNKTIVFVNALWNMYNRYALAQGWTIERLTSLEDFNHVTCVVRGKGAYGRMHYEEGLHAFRHAPSRPSDRSPLSTAKVTVLPEIDEEIEINPTDVLVNTYRVPGPAEEHAQTHIGILHVPTGLTVGYRANEAPRRKHQLALCVLKARLWEREEACRPERLSTLSHFPVQIDKRNALIRIYDEERDDVTDHRIGSLHLSLANVLGGELDTVIDQISSTFVLD
jgi:peptide chain release factor 1